MKFPDQVEAVLLGGGPVDWPGYGEWAGKGLVPIAGRPMAQWTLRGLSQSPRVSRVVLVSPQEVDWPGVDQTVPSGEKIMDSFCRGVEATLDPQQPVLISCGDLPLLSPMAVSDFITRCSWRPDADIWYGYLRKEVSQARFPQVRHTWAKLADGTFCGTGMMMLRPRVVGPLREAMAELTRARKNMPRLASRLGFSTIFAYLTHTLTVARAERTGTRLFGVACAGVESPYAEAGFNVDDLPSLDQAQRWVLDPP